MLVRRNRGLYLRTFREALDEGFDQLLLEPMSCFGTDQSYGPPFDRADCCGMELAQILPHGRPRPPPSGASRNVEVGTGQSTAITNQFWDRHPDRAPATGAVDPHVQALTGAERHDLPRSKPKPAADRRRSRPARQR